MATAVDFWNEVDRRISARLGDISGMAGTESADGTSAPPPAAGGLPIHNNAHHEPPLALQSDLESLTFLDLLDTPATYAGSPLFLLRVNAGATAVEFADGSLLYDSAGAADAAVAAHVAALDPHTQYYNETRGDARYALIGHLQATTAGGTGLTGIAADNLIYSSAINAFSATPITAFARGLIDDATAAAARTTLELNAGEAGDIWVEKAGDTMTGSLLVTGGAGVGIVNAAVDSGLSAVVLFHVRRDQNNVMDAVFENRDSGTAAQTRFQLRNGSSSLDGLTVACLGTGFTTNGVFVSDGAYIEASSNLSGGLTILARNTGGDIRLATGGFANSNLRQIILSTGEIGFGVAAPAVSVHIAKTSALTNAVQEMLRIDHNTSGTAAAGFGSGLNFRLESSTTPDQDAAKIEVSWATVTHASRAGQGKLYANYTSTARECFAWGANSTVPLLGFYGTAPAARSTGWSVTAGYTVDKAFNPEATTTLELARFVGTLADYLLSIGLLAA